MATDRIDERLKEASYRQNAGSGGLIGGMMPAPLISAAHRRSTIQPLS